MDGSRNISSGEIDVRSPFWRHEGILLWSFLVDVSVKYVAVDDEGCEEESRCQDHLKHCGQKEKRYVDARSQKD